MFALLLARHALRLGLGARDAARPEVHLAPSDKIDHLFAFLVLTMLAIFAYPRNRILIVPLGLVAFGGFLGTRSGHEHRAPRRQPE